MTRDAGGFEYFTTGSAGRRRLLRCREGYTPAGHDDEKREPLHTMTDTRHTRLTNVDEQEVFPKRQGACGRATFEQSSWSRNFPARWEFFRLPDPLASS
jgi:hypothetical protein